jgi:hypothetical protein
MSKLENALENLTHSREVKTGLGKSRKIVQQNSEVHPMPIPYKHSIIKKFLIKNKAQKS